MRRPGRGLRRVAFLFALAAPALHGSCGGGRLDGARPDIVLVVVDTLRADHLGTYGYSRPTSPAIDAFASRATVFDEAWAAAPWTLPSVMSIMTGRLPSRHRVENDGLKLAPEIPTLAETLAKSGYETGAFVSHVYVDRPFGFARGFGTFEDFGLSEPAYRPETELEPTADRVTAGALAWIRSQERRPLFLFVHYFDPHWPYDPPAAYRELFPDSYRGPLKADYDSISKFQDPLRPLPDDYRRFLIDRYDGEIRFVDEELRRLFEGLGAAGRGERTWVVLTGDHGEEFKDHGSVGHGRQLYEEVVRVPLLIGRPAARPDDATPGRRVATPVSGVDLMPTILRLAGAAPPPGLQGRSLVPFLPPGAAERAADAVGEPPPADRTLVSETVRLNASRKTVRQGPMKLIRFMEDNRIELYDLAADPGERRDLAAARPAERRALLRALFSEVDLLAGGWNLRWSSDGRARRFQGQVRTNGFIRSVVPLFPDLGKYMTERGDTLNFTDAGQAGESGLSFTVGPDDAWVSFYLMIDGRPMIQTVFLGGTKAQPREMPFRLQGLPTEDSAFTRPDHVGGRDLGFFLWRNRHPAPDREIMLDDEIRQRLRSLGYVD